MQTAVRTLGRLAVQRVRSPEALVLKGINTEQHCGKKGGSWEPPFFYVKQVDDGRAKLQSIGSTPHSERNPLGKRYVDYASILFLVFCILWFCQDLVLNGEVPFYR